MAEFETKQTIGPNQEKWLKALESGEFKQGMENLQSINDQACCCLGVACRIFELPVKEFNVQGSTSVYSFGKQLERQYAPPEIIELLGLYDKCGDVRGFHEIEEFSGRRTLVGANDDAIPFTDIAAAIRKHPHQFFRSPR